MLSRNAARECAIFLSAAVLLSVCNNSGAQAQSYSYALEASGPYANMPGQPGAPPAYITRVQQNETVQNQMPPTVVVQAPDSVAVNQDVKPQPLPPPPEAQQAPPQQTIIYHSPEQRAAAAQPAPSPYMTLGTRSGIDVGGQVSDYHYREPSGGAKISGINYGGVLGATGVFGDHFFGTLEGRYAAGWFDYSGTGTIHNRSNDLWETRGLLGRDFIFDYFSLSPFAGLGYEHLGSDLRGISSTGAALYDRDSDLLYVPVGIRPRVRLDVDSRITSLFEYDVPLQGEYTSHLGDAGNGNPTVRDDERSGFGLRGEIMYEMRYWSFGPFANYWSFDTSRPSVFHSPASTCGSPTCSLTQPSNHTIEAGLQLKFHFF